MRFADKLPPPRIGAVVLMVRPSGTRPFTSARKLVIERIVGTKVALVLVVESVSCTAPGAVVDAVLMPMLRFTERSPPPVIGADTEIVRLVGTRELALF